MRAVIFRAIPQNVERRKSDTQGSASIDGDGVARSAIVRAILEHGRFDRYFVLADSKWHRPKDTGGRDEGLVASRTTVVTPREHGMGEGRDEDEDQGGAQVHSVIPSSSSS